MSFYIVSIYFNVALYACCYQLQKPIEPFLVKNLGADNTDYAALQSFFSSIQTVGSVVAGLMLSRVGVQTVFIATFLASATCYGILASATTIELLYLSKVPGLLQHGFLVAQTAIATATETGSVRTAALGRLTTAYTIGATLGPSIGGLLGASGNYAVGATYAMWGSLLSALIAFFIPPPRSSFNHAQPICAPWSFREDTATFPDAKSKKLPQPKRCGVVLELLAVANAVLPLLVTKWMTSVGNSMYQGVQPIILRDLFHLDEAGMGFAFATKNMLTAAVSASLFGPVADAVEWRTLVMSNLGLMAVFSCLKAGCSPGSVFLSELFGSSLVMLWLSFDVALGLVGHFLAARTSWLP